MPLPAPIPIVAAEILSVICLASVAGIFSKTKAKMPASSKAFESDKSLFDSSTLCPLSEYPPKR